MPVSITPQPGGSQEDLELSTSPYFLDWLRDHNLSLALTTYQSNRLFLIGHRPGDTDGPIRLATFERQFDRPMGLYATSDDLILATRFELWHFRNILAPGAEYEGYDRCFVPRTSHTTGELDAHDVAIDLDRRIVFVNTRFSCLATVSDTHSFEVLWKPPFISAVSSEDRCHLNGLALVDGRPRYVTSISRSDAADAWRDRRASSGAVTDVTTDEVICTGLSMPHSPRWYRDRLWLLNSGTGDLGYVDPQRGTFEAVAFVPGYGRGLSFVDNLAIIGLSKPRRNRAFTGLTLDDRLREKDVQARCGLWIIDLDTGHTAHWLRIEGPVSELYDVQVLPGVNRPMALGFKTDEIRRLITVVTPDGISIHKLALEDAPAPLEPLRGRDHPALVRQNLAQSHHILSQSKDGRPAFRKGRMKVADLIDDYDRYTFPRLSRRVETQTVHDPVIVVTATLQAQLAGVAVAGEAGAPATTQVLSLWVNPSFRRNGVGAALLQELVQDLAQSGQTTVELGFRDDWPGAEALEHILRRQDWEAPRVMRRLCTLNLMSSLSESQWFREAAWPNGYEIFNWEEITLQQRRTLLQAGWIPPSLSPIQHENQLDPLGSVGLRRRSTEQTGSETETSADGSSAIVGWHLVHRLPSGAFVDQWVVKPGETRGLGRTLAIESVRRLRAAGVDTLQFFVEGDQTGLWAFCERYLIGHGLTSINYRTSRKLLATGR